MSNYVSFSEVDKVLAARDPLWVRNISPPPRKILMIDYPSAEGGKAFHVPRCDVPFNICDYVEPESLRASSGFRTMINSGMLEILTEDQAQDALADPEARKAFQNSYAEANKTHQHRSDEMRKNQEASAEVRAETQAASAKGMKSIISALDPALAKALNLIGADGQQHAPTLTSNRSPRLIALEERVKAGAVPESLLMSELSLMLGDLSIEELQGIAAGGLWPAPVAQWARERVSFRTQQQNRSTSR